MMEDNDNVNKDNDIKNDAGNKNHAAYDCPCYRSLWHQ